MPTIVRFLCLFIFININLFSDILFNLSEFNSSRRPTSNPYIIAIMVEFEEEMPDNPLTSGTGSFLSELDIDMVWNQSGLRCDGFILDKPPHNQNYFNAQIQALSNYYNLASNNNIDIQWSLISNSDDSSNGYYKLSKTMEHYSYSDIDLSNLFKESLEIAKDDIEQHLLAHPEIDIDDIIFTVFHAGISQDFSFNAFDPTVYDIKSAYIESSMFENDSNYPIINGQEIT